MKPSEKTSVKTKRPRVLANIVKKQERSHNSSGSRSFLNKTTSRYVSDLRMNNAKLAHSLAKEKAFKAELFRRVTSSEALLLSYKTLLRSAYQAVKTGLSKFNDSIDLMIEGAAILGQVNSKIVSYCPELEEPAAAHGNGTCTLTPNPPRTSAGDDTTMTPKCLSYVAPSEGGQIPPTTTVSVSSVRQCTAKPMVKGQIISKPTISLQRVNVPSRPLGKGLIKGLIKPARGVQLSANEPYRLSNVFEEVEESDDRIPKHSQSTVPPALRSQNSSPGYEPCTSKSLPSSHVVLERIPPDYVCASTELSLNQVSEDEEHLTSVHFGSFNFHNSPHKPDSYSPRKPAAPKSSSKEKKDSSSPIISKPALNSSNSDENVTESSSEDEDLALQIVECKRSYLDRTRQEDSKEGTSWNYDEAGKFRERPPKRKRSTKPVQGIIPLSARESKASKRNVEDGLSHSRELRGKPPLEQGISTKPPSEGNILCTTIINPKVSNKSYDPGSLMILHDDPENATLLDPVDMSFTCVSSDPTVVSQLSKASSRNNIENEVIHMNILKTSERPPFSEREVYVTQRTRSKKSSPGNSRLPDLHSPSPVSSPLNRKTGSKVENNENSPPDLALSSDLSRLPNVVLERLPSNVYGSLQPTVDGSKILQGKRSSEVEKEPTGSLLSPSKKRFALRSSKPGADNESDVPDEIQRRSKSERGSKEKEIKRHKKVQKSLEVPSTSASSQCVSSSSAPPSPTSSCDMDLGDGQNPHRRRRNATPASYKEPSCNRKMRRP